LFTNGGCDKQAVKGIAVYHGQRFKNSKMRCHYRDKGNFVFFCKAYKASRLSGKIYFPQTNLNGKFSNRRDADIYIIGKVSNNSFGGLGQRFIAVEEPNGGVSVQQIAAHLHIILKVFKKRVKIFLHAKLPFGAAKHALLLPFSHCRSKGNNNRPRRNFRGYVNRQPVIDGYFDGLRNVHGLSMA